MLNYQKYFLMTLFPVFLGIAFLSIFNSVAVDEIKIVLSRDVVANSIGSNVQAGSGQADFNAIRVNNVSSYPIKIDWVKITRGGGTDDDFNSVSLYSQSSSGVRSQLSSTQYLSSGVVYFDSVALNIPANSSSTLVVTAAVSNRAKAGDIVTMNLAGTDHIGVAVTGSNIQPTISGTVTGVNRTILGSGSDTVPPAAPGNVKVESTGSAPTLKISWDDPADTDLDKIRIYRSVFQGQAGVVIYNSNRGVGIIPIKIYNDTNVVAGTTYYYTVKAVDFVGNESTGNTQYSGIVYSKGLNIFLDSSSPSAGNINASSTNVDLAAFKFFSSNVDAEITNLKIDGATDASGNKNLDQINVFSLYVDGTFIASTTDSAFSFYNDGSKLTIPANSSKIISLKADIPSSSRNGAEIILKISGLTAKEPSWYPVTVYGLGTSANKMTITGGVTVAVASPSPSPVPASLVSTAGILEGAMIRARGDIDVYIVKYVGVKKFKRLILSPSVFNNYGHLKWSDIRDIDQSVVNAFTTSELVRAVGDEKVYKLYPSGDSGQKRWIKTADVFSRLGYDANAIYEINSFDRDSYVTGSDLE